MRDTIQNVFSHALAIAVYFALLYGLILLFHEDAEPCQKYDLQCQRQNDYGFPRTAP